VVGVPLVVETIALELFLLEVGFLYLVLEIIAATLVLVLVVLVVGSAQPAELVLALPASHVVATLVLLNAHLALGTGLGVQLHPGHVR